MLALQEDKKYNYKGSFGFSCSVKRVSTAGRTVCRQYISTDGLSCSKVARARGVAFTEKVTIRKTRRKKNLVYSMQPRPRKFDRWIPNSGKVLKACWRCVL